MTLGDLVRTRSARRYFPHVVLVTGAIAVAPVAAAWLLRGDGTVTSPWLCVAIALAIALIAATIGNAVWKRRPEAGDLMFSELLVWGWLRRLWLERDFRDALALVELAESSGGAAGSLTPAKRWEALGKLAMAVEALDAYTIGHSRRVARHAAVIARRMELSDAEVRRICAAAAVHDVGKVLTPRAILNKPGALTDEEYETVKRHCDDGAGIVAPLADEELTAIVRHHHERVDGTGYPARLSGDAIPLGARIIAVADTYDALIESRPYRRPASHAHAIEVLRAEQGTQFDPTVVEAFLSGYAGRRALVMWTTLAVLPQRLFSVGAARGRPGRAPAAAQGILTAAIGGVLAALVVAAGTPLARTPHQNPVAPAAATPPAATPVVATPRARARPASRRVTARRPVARGPQRPSTCQAYQPQLCAVVYLASDAGGDGRGGRAGRGGTGLEVTTGTLPFTGIDPELLALVGIALAGAGALLRPRRRRS